jgi:uncharacterized protein
MSTTHLLYLHGFRSSPRSTKAQMVRQQIETRYPGITLWCPQLPPSPREAMALVMQGIAGWPRDRMAVMGSSLGGFYATWVAEQTGCRAALLNPAVNPARDLASHIGEQSAWHDPDERFFFRPEFVDELRALTCPAITRPERLSVAGPPQGANDPSGLTPAALCLPEQAGTGGRAVASRIGTSSAVREATSVGAQFFAVIAKGDEVLDWREMTGRYPGARIRLLEGGDHALSNFAENIDEVLAFLDLAGPQTGV